MQFSYIDPGSGSVILQMMIAGVIGALAFFRAQILRVFQCFRPKKPEVPEAKPDTAKQ